MERETGFPGLPAKEIRCVLPGFLSVRQRSDLQIPAWFLTPGQRHPGCPIGILEVEPQRDKSGHTRPHRAARSHARPDSSTP